MHPFLAFRNWQKAVVILVSLIGSLIAYGSIRYGEPLFFVTLKSQDVSSKNLFLVNTRTMNSGYTIVTLAISPDGKILASGGGDNTIELWNLSTGKLLRTLHGHSDVVRSVTISSDGQILASGSWDDTIKLWNLSTGKLLRTLSGHSSAVYSAAISPNRQTIASGSTDNTIKLWDLSTGRLLHTLNGHSYAVESVAISPDGQTLASGSWDHTIKLWSIPTGRLLHTLDEEPPTSLWFLGSIKDPFESFEDPIYVAISSNGQTLISCSSSGVIKLWNLATGKQIGTLTKDLNHVTSIALSANGKILAAATLNDGIRVWNLNTKKLISTSSEQSDKTGVLTISPDGQTVVSSSNKIIQVWYIPQQ